MPHASDQNGLGGRLRLIPPGELTADQKPGYDFMTQKMVTWANASGFTAQLGDGRLIGPFNTLLRSPRLSQTFLEFQQQEGQLTSLDSRTRQVVILTVGQVWQSDYEMYAHAAVSRRASLSENTIAALKDGTEASELTATEQVARELTRSLTADHVVSDELYARALAALGEDGIVDVIMVAGCYGIVSSLLNAFNVPVPA